MCRSRAWQLRLREFAKPSQPAWAALFLLLWLPRDLQVLRLDRRETLARDGQTRAWVTGVETFAKYGQPVEAFVFSGAPEGFHRWGVEGALAYVYRRDDLRVYATGQSAVPQVLASKRVALLEWDGASLSIIEHGPGDAAAQK